MENCWFPKVLVHFRVYAGRNHIGEEMVFIQYMDCRCPVREFGQMLGIVCPQ